MTKKTRSWMYIAIAILIIATVGVSFSWFIEGFLSDKFLFAVAFVESKVTLYKAVDNNRDGVIETDENGDKLFVLLGDSEKGSVVTDGNGEPILSGGVTQYDKTVKVRFDIDAIMPTQIFTWKVAIQNIGDVRAKIYCDISVPLTDTSRASGIDVLSYRVNDKAKIFSADCYEKDKNDIFSQTIRLVNGDAVEHKGNRPEENPLSINEYIIAIKFESLDEIIAHGIDMTRENYRQYMGRIIGNIEMSVRLEDNKAQ